MYDKDNQLNISAKPENVEVTAEQLEVIEHGGSDILVSASAGSGKTHTMTKRILRLICEENVQVNRILATTFTEASALDMRDKIRSEITKKINKVVSSDKELAKRLSKQLRDFATADISTIHGFCGKLIRTYFFVVGLSPDFRIVDQAEADTMRSEAIEKTFAKAYAEGGEFLKIVDRHAVRRADGKLKELILKIYSYADSEANPESFLDGADEFYDEDGFRESVAELERVSFERLRAALDLAMQALTESKAIKYEKGEAMATALFNALNVALKCKSVYELKTACAGFKVDMSGVGNVKGDKLAAKNKVSEGRDALSDILETLNKYHGDSLDEDIMRLRSCRAHVQELVKLVKQFTDVYAKLKREENVLDFNDLEHFALKILSDEQTAQAVRESYDYIFVDECQDTNGVQDKIIAAIKNDNLLKVGDVKQSIYGFRGCRPEFFMKSCEQMELPENKGKVVRLNANFRSAPNVIKAVNEIFDYCMTGEFYGEAYSETSRLTSGGLYEKEPNALGRFELHQILVDKNDKELEKPRIYDLVKDSEQVEPDADSCTAQLINEIISSELNEEYYDVKEKTFKRVEYKDVAILARAKGKAGNYVAEIINDLSVKYNIPVTSVAEECLCDFPEVQILINALKAIDCFKWDLPLVCTLKSPIGGFSEEELFEIAGFYSDAGGKNDNFYKAYEFYLENASTPLAGKLKDFDEYFRKIRFLSDFIGAHGVLKRLISDKSLCAYCLAQKNGAEKANRLTAFMEKAFVNGGSLTVKELLNRIETGRDAFKTTKPSGENAVTVMTIHASKGLEFPVVIVCGLEKHFNKDDEKKEVLLSRKRGLAVKYYDDEKRTSSTTPLRRLILDEADEQTIKEEMRLFYVATTRAKYSLHLVYAGAKDERGEAFDKDDANAYFKLLPKSIPATQHIVDNSGKLVMGDNSRTVMIGDADEATVKKLKSAFAFEYPFNADVSLPIKSTVTAVNLGEQSSGRLVLPLFDEYEDLNAKTSAALGTNAHRLLELYDFDRRDDFAGELKRMLTLGLITENELEGLDLSRLEAAIKGSAFDGLAGKRLYREKGFIVNVPANLIYDVDSVTPVLVQGVIDLLAVDGDRASVIDYKYSSLNGEKLKEKYRKQLNLYAYAVEKCLGLKVENKTIVSLLTASTVEID